ncbi:MAG TPA: HAMP domain-containing sensor histidine kinase [Phycisphaerae bacterium]|nr:HAMP domain-containing sensor histidine kinase [Phycisphaerae bacterium]
MNPTRPTRSKTPAVQSAPPPTTRTIASEELLQEQIQRLEEQFGRLREQVRQTQQLASLGTAAAMIAHEYNNMMAVVVGRARMALDTGERDLMIKALELTLKQASIVSAMADRILGLAVHEAPTREPVGVREVVEGALTAMCRDPAKDGITLKIEVDDDLKVRADERQLLQVFFNLLLNAREAIQHRSGRIKVGAAPDGADSVRIWVKDNGCGIAPENRERIFEPFVTTKKRDASGKVKGSGLGLAICRDIITEHQGSISVESEPDEGTTFTIILPRAD